MSSNIEIKKKCEWCGNIFIARKTTTTYCSPQCSNLAYKDRARKERVQKLQTKFDSEAKKNPTLEKEYLTPTEVSTLLGIGRTSTYRYIRTAQIKAVRFKGKTLIKRTDIEQMFDYLSIQEKSKPKEKSPITEFYTTAEIKEKYSVAESWIFIVAKKHNIPKTSNRGKTYWSKKHIDTYFAKKAANPDIAEWYTVPEIQDKFGMTLSAIYTLVSNNAIPKKKEGIMVSYSKKHFDIAKGIAQPEEPKFYTAVEAMEKFNLTRDQLYHYVKYHNIPKVKAGNYIKISRPELDKLLSNPKIE